MNIENSIIKLLIEENCPLFFGEIWNSIEINTFVTKLAINNLVEYGVLEVVGVRGGFQYRLKK